jgi:hypothetical protein
MTGLSQRSCIQPGALKWALDDKRILRRWTGRDIVDIMSMHGTTIITFRWLEGVGKLYIISKQARGCLRCTTTTFREHHGTGISQVKWQD